MSSVGEVAAGLAGCLESAAEAGSAIRTCRDRIAEQTELLASALAGSSRPAAEQSLAHLAAARDRLEDALAALAGADELLQAYLSTLVGPAGSITPAEPGPTGGAASRPTLPSLPPDPTRRPDGEPEWINPSAGTSLRQSLELQHAAAATLAAAGYRVRHRPRVHDGKSPDFEVEGSTFDCYAPERRTPLPQIRKTLSRKARAGQANRFVVNLDRSDLTAGDLRRYLTARPSSGVHEVLVVRDGAVVRAWP